LISVTHDAKNWNLNSPSQTSKASNNIKAIACDKRGYLWVSTHSSVLIDHDVVSVYNKKQWISFTLNNDATARPYFITDIAIDKDSHVWFATDDGCIVLLKQDSLAIDSLFAKEGVGTRPEFRLIPKKQREMVYYDLLGRRCLRTGDFFKKTHGVLIGSDNLRTKKIVNVK
jgi:ligand-binding sensor domain-containing protein